MKLNGKVTGSDRGVCCIYNENEGPSVFHIYTVLNYMQLINRSTTTVYLGEGVIKYILGIPRKIPRLLSLF